jgi:hypothetical protein
MGLGLISLARLHEAAGNVHEAVAQWLTALAHAEALFGTSSNRYKDIQARLTRLQEREREREREGEREREREGERERERKGERGREREREREDTAAAMIVSVGAPASVQWVLEDGEMGSVSPDNALLAHGGGAAEKGAYSAPILKSPFHSGFVLSVS